MRLTRRENNSYNEVSAWEEARVHVSGQKGMKITAAVGMLSVKGRRNPRRHAQAVHWARGPGTHHTTVKATVTQI